LAFSYLAVECEPPSLNTPMLAIGQYHRMIIGRNIVAPHKVCVTMKTSWKDIDRCSFRLNSQIKIAFH